MCVPEVCSHEIVCVKGSVAPDAAGESHHKVYGKVANNQHYQTPY